MEYLNVKTKGNASPQGKPKVYFTCHLGDFERTFSKVCENIFKTHDCAVYFKADMAAEFPVENREVDLESMNLFVIPVTFKLLRESSPAMDVEFKYAQEKHIPVLPIMFDPGLDSLYSLKFGDLQYLDPYSQDATAIRYEEKLKKYLDSVLISDEMAEKIRAAFDAYIFLSYRKKDRKYANELMRLIHSNPVCRDIAIWYDEFLTPGENFNDAINKALEKSELFALLVTPNLINEENYVQSVEYPAAHNAGKKILPAEMVETDRKDLRKQFEGIPECVNARDEKEFRERLLAEVKRLALRENDAVPEHNFLIGLAYLDGIDVEVDRARAAELITGAAEAKLPEAMEKLRSMYHDGVGVKRDYMQVVSWSEKLADYYRWKYGFCHPDALDKKHELGIAWREAGEYEKAGAVFLEAYKIWDEEYGRKHPGTIKAMCYLAEGYALSSWPASALSYGEMACRLQLEVLGEDHPNTPLVLDGMARIYELWENYEKARELYEKVYRKRRESLGEEHPATLTTLTSLALACSRLGDHQRALPILENIYQLRLKELGEKNPDTITALYSLSLVLDGMEEYQRALELKEKVYELRCEVLGKDHPAAKEAAYGIGHTYIMLGEYERALWRYDGIDRHDLLTLAAAHHMAYAKGKLGQFKSEREYMERTYSIECAVLSEKHPQTLRSLKYLADIYRRWGEHEKEAKYIERVYWLQRGEDMDEVCYILSSALFAGSMCVKHGDWQGAVERFERAYQIQYTVMGEEYAGSIETLCNLARSYTQAGDLPKGLELYEKAHRIQLKTLGENHPDTLLTMYELADVYERSGDCQRACELREKLSGYFRQETLAGERSDTFKMLKELAEDYREMWHGSKSLDILEKGYGLRCKALGEDSIPALTVLNFQASFLQEARDYEKSLKLWEKLYRLRCKAQGEEHPDTLTALRGLAAVYGRLGKTVKEYELMETAYQIQCKTVGKEHPDSVTLSKALLDAYDQLGDQKEDIELIHRLRRVIRDGAQSDVLEALDELADVYRRLGDHQAVLETEEAAYRIRCEVLGPEDPETLITRHNIAMAYGGLGDSSKKIELLEEVYRLSCISPGEKHPDTLVTLHCLASEYFELKNYSKALELFEKAYAFRCETLGEEHSDTLETMFKLADSCGKMGDDKRQYDLIEKLYHSQCRILGEEHPDILDLLNCLLFTNGSLNDGQRVERAIWIWEKIYLLRRKLLGEKHFETLDAMYNLAVIYDEAGDNAKAQELMKKRQRLWREKNEKKSNTDLWF